jgi:hypothetical protein
MGMLLKIGAGLINQSIGHSVQTSIESNSRSCHYWCM